jgi:hypothetical protein
MQQSRIYHGGGIGGGRGGSGFGQNISYRQEFFSVEDIYGHTGYSQNKIAYSGSSGLEIAAWEILDPDVNYSYLLMHCKPRPKWNLSDIRVKWQWLIGDDAADDAVVHFRYGVKSFVPGDLLSSSATLSDQLANISDGDQTDKLYVTTVNISSATLQGSVPSSENAIIQAGISRSDIEDTWSNSIYLVGASFEFKL